MDGISAITWLIDLTERISQLWSWVSTPLFTLGDFEFSFLGIFSTGLIVAIITFKLVDLIVPV